MNPNLVQLINCYLNELLAEVCPSTMEATASMIARWSISVSYWLDLYAYCAALPANCNDDYDARSITKSLLRQAYSTIIIVMLFHDEKLIFSLPNAVLCSYSLKSNSGAGYIWSVAADITIPFTSTSLLTMTVLDMSKQVKDSVFKTSIYPVYYISQAIVCQTARLHLQKLCQQNLKTHGNS